MTIRTLQLLLEFGILGSSITLSEPVTGTVWALNGTKLETRALWGQSRGPRTSPVPYTKPSDAVA